MTIILLILTAIIAILQLQNLNRRPVDYKAWIILVLIISTTVASYFIESGKSKAEKYAKDSGKLSPDKTYNKELLWELNGDTIIFSDGIMDFKRSAHSYLRGIDFKAWLEDNRILVTTDVRDSTGNIIAKLNRNEWTLNPNERLDKNFDDNALEVIDNSGNVVFQIKMVKNLIFLQGLFYQPNGNATTITRLDMPDGKKITFMATFMYEKHGLILPPHPLLRIIQPLFKYPSSLHNGSRYN